MALAAACCTSTSQAFAQDTLETVVVTGTRTGTNIADVAPVGTESIVIDREKILSTGLVNSVDVVRTLPQVQTLDSYYEGGTGNGYGGNTTQGNGINLRGLGAGATLVLVDGRRITPTGTAYTMTENNQLPLAALDRIEVLTDGASAIYGSDAISGVINYVMRKDYEGLQFAPRYTYAHGYSEWGVALTAGTSWDSLGGIFGKGNIIVTYDYDQRTSMKTSTQPFLKKDLTQYGGVDDRYLFGSASSASNPSGVGNIVTYWSGDSSYAAYKNPGKSSLTASDLTAATSNDDLNLKDAADDSTYLGRLWRHQFTAFVNQRITPNLEVYYEGFLTRRQTTTYEDHTTTATLYSGTYYNGYNVSTSSTSPYAIKDSSGNYLGTGSGYGTVTQYIQLDLGRWTTLNPDENYTGTLGFNAKLPFDWNATGYFTNSIDHTCGVCEYGTNIDTYALQHYISTGDINPLDGISDAEKKLFLGDNYQYSRNMADDFLLKFDGSLPWLKLPGGVVKMAIGGEYTYSTEHLANGANRSTEYTDLGMINQSPRDYCDDYATTGACWNEFGWDNKTSASRGIWAGFVEAYLPLIGAENGIPLVKNFLIDAAVRYDSYSDVGSTTNPKVGATWDLNDELTGRGSWGTSFRAPSLTDSNPEVFSYFYLTAIADYTGRTGYNPWYSSSGTNYAGVLIIGGDSPNVKPETSENWSTGIEYKPQWLEGFDLALTYYSVAYTNKIDSPNATSYLASAASAQEYSQYITKIDNTICTSAADADSRIKEAIASTLYQAWYDKSYACNIGYILDARTQNIAATKQRGLDVNINYLYPTDEYGLFTFGLYASTVLDNKVQSTKGGSFIEKINGYGQPVRWKGRGTIGWMYDGFNVMWFINYIGNGDLNAGGTTYALSGTNGREPAYITADLNLSYDLSKVAGWKGFAGTRLSLNVRNVFDINPPISLTSSYTAYDPYRYSGYATGRIMTLQLTKDF
jgi:iron complex outermembrane recepter protein